MSRDRSEIRPKITTYSKWPFGLNGLFDKIAFFGKNDLVGPTLDLFFDVTPKLRNFRNEKCEFFALHSSTLTILNMVKLTKLRRHIRNFRQTSKLRILRNANCKFFAYIQALQLYHSGKHAPSMVNWAQNGPKCAKNSQFVNFDRSPSTSPLNYADN